MICTLLIFSGCVCHLEQLHAQPPFLFSIFCSINLIPFLDTCSIDYLQFFHPGCWGVCCFTWATARSQQLLFVVLAAGLWCFTAGYHVKSPLIPQPLLHSSDRVVGKRPMTGALRRPPRPCQPTPAPSPLSFLFSTFWSAHEQEQLLFKNNSHARRELLLTS